MTLSSFTMPRGNNNQWEACHEARSCFFYQFFFGVLPFWDLVRSWTGERLPSSSLSVLRIIALWLSWCPGYAAPWKWFKPRPRCWDNWFWWPCCDGYVADVRWWGNIGPPDAPPPYIRIGSHAPYRLSGIANPAMAKEKKKFNSFYQIN